MRAFFTRRSPRYDRLADRPFWAFSDRVLAELLSRHLLDGLREDAPVRFLDAGGGTGRWALRLLARFPRASGVLVDVSPGMLQVARRKAAGLALTSRLSILEHDLHRPIPESLGRFDLALAFHNVAGLVADPAALIRRLTRALRPGGRIALVLPSLHAAAAKCLKAGRDGELRRLRSRGAVRYGSGVPEVLVFTPALARECLRRTGCRDVTVLGFPVSVQPEGEGERLPGPSRCGPALSRLAALEADLCSDEEAAARGQSLLALGRIPRTGRRGEP